MVNIGNGILSTIGAHRNLKLYASPAQLNKVIVLLSMPADFNQSDRVEKINKIGSPEEKPKNNSEKHIRKVKEVINFFKLDIKLIIKDLISKN